MIDQVFHGDPFLRFERFTEPVTYETLWSPSVDFSETDAEYVIRLDVPGIPKENLDVNLENNVLTLSGRRELHKDEETEKYIWREREEGRFMRTIRLPAPVAQDKIQAMVEDGILIVHLSKTTLAEKSKVVIQ